MQLAVAPPSAKARRRQESEIEPAVMSVKDAAVALDVCPATIYNWIGEGRLVATKIGGRRLIPTSEVRRLVGADA